MLAKSLGFVVGLALLGLLGACSSPIITSGNNLTSLSLNLGPGPAVRAIKLSDSASRFLARDNASATLVIQTVGQPDSNYAFNPQAGSVTIELSRGYHTFIIKTFDSALNLLTSGTSSMYVGANNSSLSMTLNPAVTGVAGTPINLSAGQVMYLTIPGSTTSISSTCIFVTGGPATKFWICAADGSYSGNPSSTNYFYTSTNPAPPTLLIRVQNSGLSGTIVF